MTDDCYIRFIECDDSGSKDDWIIHSDFFIKENLDIILKLDRLIINGITYKTSNYLKEYDVRNNIVNIYVERFQKIIEIEE